MLKEPAWRIKLLSEYEICDNSEVIKRLIDNCIENTYSISDTSDFVSEKYRNLIEHKKDGSAYPIGAFVGTELAGFLWAYVIRRLSCEVFHIAYISVLEGYRGSGIARGMIQFCTGEAKRLGIHKLELIAGVSNVEAMRLYNKTGFIPDRMTLIKNLPEQGE